MQVKIKIVSNSGVIPAKSAKGTAYESIEVVYKENGEGSVKAVKMNSFYGGDAYNVLKVCQPGEWYEIVKEKKGEFWNVVQAVKIEGAISAGTSENSTPVQSSSSDNAASRSSGAGVGRVTGSNYETPDERKLRRDFDQVKHRQIGAQGCINSAIGILTANSGKFTVLDVIETAKVLSDFVFEGKTPESVKRKSKAVAEGTPAQDPMADMNDDIPF